MKLKNGRDKLDKSAVKRERDISEKSAIKIERGKPAKCAIKRSKPAKSVITRKRGRPAKHLFHKPEDGLQHSYYRIKKVQSNEQDFMCMHCELKVSAYSNLLHHFNTIGHRENLSQKISVNENDMGNSFSTEGKSMISSCHFTFFQSAVEVTDVKAPVEQLFVILTLVRNQQLIYMCPYCSCNFSNINTLVSHFKSKSHLLISKSFQKCSLEMKFSLCMEKIFDVKEKYCADIYVHYYGFDHYCLGTLSESPTKGKVNNALNTKSNVKIEATEYVPTNFLSGDKIKVNEETYVVSKLLIPEIIFHENEQITDTKIEMSQYSNFSEGHEYREDVNGSYNMESNQHISTCENKYSIDKHCLQNNHFRQKSEEIINNNMTILNGAYQEENIKGKDKTDKSINKIKINVIKSNENSSKDKMTLGNKVLTKTLKVHINELKKGLKDLEKTIKTYTKRKFQPKKHDYLPKKSECMNENVKIETSDIKLVHEFICARCGIKSDCLDMMKDHEEICLRLNKTPKIPLTAWYWDSFTMCKCEICHISKMNKNAYLLHSHNHQSALTYMQELDLESDSRPITNSIDQRKFNCDICKKYTSKFSSNLAHHIYKEHRDTFIFKCDYCYFATMNLCILNDHMQYIHTLSSTIIYTPYFF